MPEKRFEIPVRHSRNKICDDLRRSGRFPVQCVHPGIVKKLAKYRGVFFSTLCLLQKVGKHMFEHEPDHRLLTHQVRMLVDHAIIVSPEFVQAFCSVSGEPDSLFSAVCDHIPDQTIEDCPVEVRERFSPGVMDIEKLPAGIGKFPEFLISDQFYLKGILQVPPQVRDAVGTPYHAPFIRAGVAILSHPDPFHLTVERFPADISIYGEPGIMFLAVMAENPIQNLQREIAIFNGIQEVNALYVVPESPHAILPTQIIQKRLSQVTVRGMPNIVAESDRFDQVFV